MNNVRCKYYSLNVKFLLNIFILRSIKSFQNLMCGLRTYRTKSQMAMLAKKISDTKISFKILLYIVNKKSVTFFAYIERA